MAFRTYHAVFNHAMRASGHLIKSLHALLSVIARRCMRCIRRASTHFAQEARPGNARLHSRWSSRSWLRSAGFTTYCCLYFHSSMALLMDVRFAATMRCCCNYQ